MLTSSRRSPVTASAVFRFLGLTPSQIRRLQKVAADLGAPPETVARKMVTISLGYPYRDGSLEMRLQDACNDLPDNVRLPADGS